MKIKTRLMVNTVVTLAFTLVIGLVIFLSVQDIQEKEKAHGAIFKISKTIIGLRSLSFEYLMNPHPRILSQWQVKSAELEGLFRNFQTEEDQKKVFQEIDKQYQSVKAAFLDLKKALPEKEKANQPDSYSQQEILEVFGAQFILKIQDMVFDTFILMERIDVRKQKAQNNTAILVIALVLSLALFIGLNSYFSGKKIISNIFQLQEGTRRVAGGDLNFRVNLDTRDEMGQLAKAFNQMTQGLKESYTSIGNLEKEIQERKRAEDALTGKTRELTRSNQELGYFAYVASHDLQEPLRMVVSYLQLIEKRYKDKLDQDGKDFIGYAVDGGTRLQRLIGDLLAYSRVQTRGQEFLPVEVTAIFKQVVKNLKVSIEESGALITHDPLPLLIADSGQMTQLFQNLVINAIKFHNEKTPEIHIGVARQKQDWLFSIKDQGIGLDMQFKDRIFGLFQRLHGREEYSGTGIGLAICKRIVERHGGRIWVESIPGKGSTFYFTIPPKEGTEHES